MNGMTCAELRQLASEFAVDLLDGEDRARVCAHLETCQPCRSEVAALTEAAEEILLLGPEVDPPADFASRVVERVEQLVTNDAAPHRRRRPRWHLPRRALAAAAVLVLVMLAALALVIARTGREAGAVSAPMRTGRGEVVGRVELRGDQPTSVAVSLPNWSQLVRRYGEPGISVYWLAVELDDHSRDLHAVHASGDTWTWDIATDRAAVSSVAVVDDQGRVWCSARFH